MPRLFTGIAIPTEIGAQLARYRGGLPGARWIEPSDYHITLRFLGDVDGTLAEDFHALLGERRSRPPLNIVLDGLAGFGGDRPRAIYAALAPNLDLADLQDEHERFARRAGAEPERRRFTPHVTLARLRREAGPETVAGYLASAGIVPRLSFTATEVALFSARESRGGGPYVVEATYPLI